MQFSKHNNLYQVSWVSGPRHNKLALGLSDNWQAATVIRALPAEGDCRHEKLNEQLILANVLDGIAEANRKFDCRFGVSRVEYVENDTGPEAIFNFLTQQIVEHLMTGKTFAEETQ